MPLTAIFQILDPKSKKNPPGRGSEDSPPTNVETGAFPYPIPDGPIESRYLTWVRNHSNCMAERGFLDYFRLFAVLLRGIPINFLTLLPYLVALALVFGLTYKTLLLDWEKNAAPVTTAEAAGTPETAPSANGPAGGKPTAWSQFFLSKKVTDPGWAKSVQETLHSTRTPYLFSPLVLIAAGVWVLLFPIIIRLAKIVGYKRSLETGSSSSVKGRDLFERSFGFFLLLIFAVGLLETFPVVVHFFHDFRQMGSTGRRFRPPPLSSVSCFWCFSITRMTTGASSTPTPTPSSPSAGRSKSGSSVP